MVESLACITADSQDKSGGTRPLMHPRRDSRGQEHLSAEIKKKARGREKDRGKEKQVAECERKKREDRNSLAHGSFSLFH